MYTKLRKIPKILLTLLYGVVLVWVLLLGYEWGKTYFVNQQKTAYKEVPFEFKLKAKPEDVIYSQAYKTPSGIDEVKYAYLTEEVLPIPNEDISRRTPASQTEVLEKYKDENGKPMEKLHTTFVSKPQFYQNSGTWRQIEYATTTAEVFSMSGAIPSIQRRELAERIIPGDTVFGATSTFYPNANVETTSVDGFAICSYIGGVSAATSWSNARSGTGCNSKTADDTSATSTLQAALNTGGPNWVATIERFLFLFDTSSLGSGATISSATVGLYVTAKSSGAQSAAVNIYSSAPASNTGLVAADYDTTGTTAYASNIAITSITTSAYNTFTLNSTGIAAISKTSITKFSLKEALYDADGTTPTTGLNETLSAGMADTGGTSYDPKLDVTYTLPGGFSVGNWFPF